MVLAVDVGNTNTVIGVLDGERLVVSGRLSTQPYDTDDDCALTISSFLRINMPQTGKLRNLCFNVFSRQRREKTHEYVSKMAGSRINQSFPKRKPKG